MLLVVLFHVELSSYIDMQTLIVSISHPDFHEIIMCSLDKKLILNTEELLSKGWSSDVDVTYTQHDCILYALGVGAEELKYIYEQHSDFRPLPTLPFVLTFRGNDTNVPCFPSRSLAILQPLPFDLVHRILDYRRRIVFSKILPSVTDDAYKYCLRGRPIAVAEQRSGVVVEYEVVLHVYDPRERQGLDEVLDSNVICSMFCCTYLVGVRSTKSAGSRTFNRTITMPIRPPEYSLPQMFLSMYVICPFVIQARL